MRRASRSGYSSALLFPSTCNHFCFFSFPAVLSLQHCRNIGLFKHLLREYFCSKPIIRVFFFCPARNLFCYFLFLIRHTYQTSKTLITHVLRVASLKLAPQFHVLGSRTATPISWLAPKIFPPSLFFHIIICIDFSLFYACAWSALIGVRFINTQFRGMWSI